MARLSRADQDAILMPTVRAYRTVMGGSPWESHDLMVLDSFRAALRLDDPYLDGIISGAKAAGVKLQWSDGQRPDNPPYPFRDANIEP